MKELLAKKASRANSYKVVSLVGNSPKLYKNLIEIIIDYECPYSEKAAWAMNHCFEENMGFFEDYFSEFTEILKDETYSDSVKRNIVRIFQFIEIPEEFHATIIDSCFQMVIKKDTAIALKAFSLGVLDKMTKRYPELQNELKSCLEDIIPNASSGLKNRAQKILIRLGNS